MQMQMQQPPAMPALPQNPMMGSLTPEQQAMFQQMQEQMFANFMAAQ